jgi:hypothetical protein
MLQTIFQSGSASLYLYYTSKSMCKTSLFFTSFPPLITYYHFENSLLNVMRRYLLADLISSFLLILITTKFRFVLSPPLQCCYCFKIATDQTQVCHPYLLSCLTWIGMRPKQVVHSSSLSLGPGKAHTLYPW